MSPDLATAYICMLAVDSLLGFVTALEALTDRRTAEKGHVSENAPPDPLTCVALVNSTWKIVLPVLSYLLGSVYSEALMLLLLKVGELSLIPAPWCHDMYALSKSKSSKCLKPALCAFLLQISLRSGIHKGINHKHLPICLNIGHKLIEIHKLAREQQPCI